MIYNSSSKALKTVKSLYLDSNRSFSLDVSKGTYYLGIKSDKERSFEVTPSFTPSSQAEASDSDGKGTTAINGATTPFEKTGEAFGFDEAKSDTLEAGKTKYYILEVPEAGALSFYITGFSITDNAEIAIFDKNAKFVCRESLYGSKTISADVVKGTYYAVISTNKERSYQITPSFEPSYTPTITLSMSVKKGKTLTIGTILNTKNDKVTWTTANKKIATVSSKGKIKGVKKGTTTITAKTKSGLEVEIQIKVK